MGDNLFFICHLKEVAEVNSQVNSQVNSKMNKRVFILDYETISPLGIGHQEIVESLYANKLVGNSITHFPTLGLCESGAAVIESNLEHLYESESEQIKKAMRFDRKLEFLIACYYLMEKKLQTLFDLADPKRKGVVLGVGLDVSPLELLAPSIEKKTDNIKQAYVQTILDFNINENRLNYLLNPIDLYAVYLAQKLDLRAFQRSVLTACSASTQAIIEGSKALSEGLVDLVLVGGTDSILNQFAYIAFSKLGVISTLQEHPSLYCKPLDQNRAGTLVGEACGLSVLASEDFVQKNGLNPRFEIIGTGLSLDGYKITSPDPEYRGMSRAMKQAIKEAGISADELDYVNLHGTGTLSNDQFEVNALIEALDFKAQNLCVSSTKSRHGHAIAAAGIQEFNILCDCLDHNFIPCTMGLESPIKAPGLDLVQINNMSKTLKIGMTNNFAFGGANASLIIRKIY